MLDLGDIYYLRYIYLMLLVMNFLFHLKFSLTFHIIIPSLVIFKIC
jgi:hypothetical protein